MTTNLNDAAGTVIDLTDKLGATAVDIQHTTYAARTVREAARVASRHPGRLAALGCGLLVTAGILAARGPRERATAMQAQMS